MPEVGDKLGITLTVDNQTASGLASAQASVAAATEGIASSFATLGVTTEAGYEAQVATINGAYQAILASGTATANELVAAEAAAQEKLAAIEAEKAGMWGQTSSQRVSAIASETAEEQGLLGAFHDWWKSSALAVGN